MPSRKIEQRRAALEHHAFQRQPGVDLALLRMARADPQCPAKIALLEAFVALDYRPRAVLAPRALHLPMLLKIFETLLGWLLREQ